MLRLICAAVLVIFGFGREAPASQSIPDQYPVSVLYSKPVEVIPHIWSAIGATGPPSYENSGHNNNLSFIVTGDGVIVINAGACYRLAEALHKEIKRITNQPVKLVINENGQGHAMLGNAYWAERQVPILAHEDAAAEFEERAHDILDRMKSYNGDKAQDTKIQGPTETFTGRKVIEMGGVRIEVITFGPAHSPGDISVWLPDRKLVIAGDMAFHERLPPIFDETDTAGWLESWDKFEALGAVYIVPGHGHPTNIDQVRRYTKDYLVYLRGKVRQLIDQGGALDQAYEIDQSPFAHLDTFHELAKRNAGRVFVEMEFD